MEEVVDSVDVVAPVAPVKQGSVPRIRAEVGDRSPRTPQVETIRRMSKPLADLIARDANEGDRAC